MSSVNKAILMGHLGKDPDVKRMESGNVVASFSLATNRKYKDKKGEIIDETTWHNIIAWNGHAEVAIKYLTKGRQVFIEGTIRNRTYVDQQDNTKYISEIVVTNITLINSGQPSQPSQYSQQTIPHAQPQPQPPPPQSNSDDDDLPF